MPFVCDIAGDIGGAKRNLRVEFPLPPALHEITRAAEALFTVLMQSEAAERTTATEAHSNRNNAPYQRISDLFFAVESVAVLDESSRTWVAVRSGAQVPDGGQLYCFQPIHEPSCTLTAHGDKTEGNVGQGAPAQQRHDADSPGVIPPPERLVVWDRGTAALYMRRSCTTGLRRPLRKGEEARADAGALPPPQPRVEGHTATAGVSAEDDSGSLVRSTKAKAQPSFLTPTASSARKMRDREACNDASAEQADSVQFVSYRQQQHPQMDSSATAGEGVVATPSPAELDSVPHLPRERADGMGANDRFPPSTDTATAPVIASSLPIPSAALLSSKQAHPTRDQKSPPSSLVSHRPLTFSEKARAVLDVLPTEPCRSFVLLRDLFHFTKVHGLLSREFLLSENRRRGGQRQTEGHRSPFFTDRLRDDHQLSLEGVLRTADADRDGCISSAEWLGFCLEHPTVLELFFLFLQHGTETEGACSASLGTAMPGRRYHHDPVAGVPVGSLSVAPSTPWERLHLLPARSGPPRCEACEVIEDRLAWPFQHRRSGSRANGIANSALTAHSLPQQHQQQHEMVYPHAARARGAAAWESPYPSAMPTHDFDRRVRLLGVHDSLERK